jgi:VanZ family protein
VSLGRVQRLLLWIPPVGYMALIFFASSVPGDQLPGHFWDKAVHVLVYGGLGVLFLLPLAEGRIDAVTTRVAAAAVLLATLYGVFDEIHQAFTPERSPDWHDLLADFLGASLGVIVMLMLLAVWRRARGEPVRRPRA